jgi:hypothetical protein
MPPTNARETSISCRTIQRTESLSIQWQATRCSPPKHDEQETFLSNLPDPGKVEFVVDGHAASGNPTDPILDAASPTMMLKMLLCFRFNNEPKHQDHNPMRHTRPMPSK